MELSDITIVCADCAVPFVLTTSERQWFIDNNMQQPKRCRPCRQERKQKRQDGQLGY